MPIFLYYHDPHPHNPPPLQWRHNKHHGVSIHLHLTVYSTVCISKHQRNHHSLRYWLFVRGIHWRPVDSPHKGPVTCKTFPWNVIIVTSKQQKTSTTYRPYYRSDYILQVGAEPDTEDAKPENITKLSATPTQQGIPQTKITSRF